MLEYLKTSACCSGFGRQGLIANLKAKNGLGLFDLSQGNIEPDTAFIGELDGVADQIGDSVESRSVSYLMFVLVWDSFISVSF